jgi:hypothetical protein
MPRKFNSNDNGGRNKRMRGPCAFREADVRRSIRAARAAGLDIASVEFSKDGFRIVPKGIAEAAPAQGTNEWDTV